MNTTKKPPKLHSSKFKRTKIIATIGPSTDDYQSILKMIKAGANGLRLNCSHGTNEERIKQIKWIRKAAKEYSKPVAIIQDLQGPKIRLGDFEGVIPVEKGQSLRFKYLSDYQRSGIIPTQYDLSKKVKRGQRILIYDGNVKTVVTSVADGVVHVRVDNDGVLLSRKGMNLPDTDFAGDVVTKKDREDAAFGSVHDVDYVAMSFVQTADDVNLLRKILNSLGSSAKIIAKIETVVALQHIDAIVDAADAVMVARGDLATETLPEAVPVEQRRIVGVCRKKSKPVIIATQMLATMTESAEPTRAEVSDVATATVIGTDCVMLSDETAMGRFPIDSIKIMKKIVKYTEANNPIEVIYKHSDKFNSLTAAISEAVINLSHDVKATAIIAETKSGATALQLASRRPNKSIIAVTSQERVANQLAIVYGVKSYIRPDGRLVATKLTDWLVDNKVLLKGEVVVTASGHHPGVVGTTDTIKVRVLT